MTIDRLHEIVSGQGEPPYQAERTEALVHTAMQFAEQGETFVAFWLLSDMNERGEVLNIANRLKGQYEDITVQKIVHGQPQMKLGSMLITFIDRPQRIQGTKELVFVGGSYTESKVQNKILYAIK